jgi:endonuclease/exonuclease/phosphatase (EEP) superfamily protein YafD
MEGWERDFATLSAGADLMTLQEVTMADGLRRLLDDGRYQWDLTAAFLSRKRETGVLTGARTPPDQVCADSHAEPLLIIPKAVLVSRYPLANREKSLLVANIHLINFTLGMEEYLGQLQRLEETLSSHDGPLLLTGDFNTWSDRRWSAVHALAERLALREVGFAEGGRASFFGRTVDHVFTRGLETVDARAVRVATSDHNPLLVTFRVPGEEGP